MSNAGTKSVLVIGLGNDLRGDDGVGRRVAERVALRELPGVEVLSLHQAGPELAADMAGRERVVFVDASVEVEQVEVRPVEADTAVADGGMGHAIRPETLSGMTRAFYGAEPRVWAVHIPAAEFAFGTPVSERVEAHAEKACEEICKLAVASPEPVARA